MRTCLGMLQPEPVTGKNVAALRLAGKEEYVYATTAEESEKHRRITEKSKKPEEEPFVGTFDVTYHRWYCLLVLI